MKRLITVLPLFLVMVLTAGCQVPSSPPAYGPCPANPTTNTAWVPLNPVGSTSNAPTSALTYVDKPPIGVQCYVVVAYDPNSGSSTFKLYSVPSNTAIANFTATSAQINLSWVASGTAGVIYVVSRASATLISPPLPPALNNPAVAMEVKPALPTATTQAPMYLAKVNAPKALIIR